ncbi:MAG: class I SAM-dependent methyltransferase [bacterium]|nr:class I SAM-dependent methyltransferase [bacterium]
MNKDNKTSWGKVAGWYSDLLEKEEGTYQKDLILPNLIRLMDIKRGDVVLDLACGQGFFSREFLKAGAKVMGVDVARELIHLASEITKKEMPDAKAEFITSPADDLSFIKEKSIDKIVIVLAIQNIENVAGVFKECQRVLKPSGKLFLVLNHPAFRIPKQSSWQWDEKTNDQYRRIDQYLSESKIEIQMHPGDKPEEKTISFHRPLQYYFKFLGKNGFAVDRLEEWNSNKKSQPGPRAKAEDKIRKEIPIFMFLEAIKI